MLSRLNLLTRHVRPFSTPVRPAAFAIMASSSAAAAASRTHLASKLHSAACLIIGDEVLNGKTRDSNSHYMSQWCFRLGISLARIEVIADEASEIAEAVTRMSSRYDLVVTSGGIGPTHDDITYQSVADAFGLDLTLHDAAFRRMRDLSRPHPSQPDFSWDVPSPALEAKKRMVILPWNKELRDDEQVLFVSEDLWVPVSVVNGNVHILPGVPRLFERLLDGVGERVKSRVQDPDKGVHRITFSTPLAESAVAGYLTELSQRVESKGVKVGSYPRWGKSRNTVTLVGRDAEYMEGLVKEVEQGVKGRRVQKEDEDDSEGGDMDS